MRYARIIRECIGGGVLLLTARWLIGMVVPDSSASSLESTRSFRLAVSDLFSVQSVGLPARTREPRHVALLVGISDYRHFELDGPAGMSDLQGPRNDVQRMRRALERWKFQGPEVKVLVDSQASRKSLLNELQWVAERASDPTDAVVIFWSGHGSFARDGDGDEARLERDDKYDEALVPWDARHIDDPSQLLIDDDIRRFLSSLKTSNVTLIIDACYSGTATRGDGNRPRGPTRPSDASAREGMDVAENPQNHVLIAASSAHEVAHERQFGTDSSTVFGILTYFLTEALERAEPDARYDDVIRDVRSQMRGQSRQAPQLEGLGSSRVFHVRGDVARRPFVTLARSESSTTIDAGAVHGVRVGAVYEVFRPNEMAFTGRSLGRVVVERVGHQTSAAKVQSGSSFPNGARAVLARVPGGASLVQGIDVFLDSTASDVASPVSGIPWVRVSRSETSPVWISRDGGLLRVRHRGFDVAPLDTIGQQQKLVAGTLARGYRSGADLCRPLWRAFVAEAFDQIRNPSAPKTLNVQLKLVRNGDQVIDDGSSADTALIGERYDLYARVQAPTSWNVYISVAVAGYVSESMMLYPSNTMMNHPIELNRWVRLVSNLTAEEPAGDELIKAVASTEQYDFASLLASLPNCVRLPQGENRGDFRSNRQESDSAAAWTAMERKLVFRRAVPQQR